MFGSRLVLFGILALLAAPLHAGVMLQMTTSASVVNSGDDVTVQVSLIDDGSVVGVGGLFSAAVSLEAAGSASASVDALADITGNGAFANVEAIPFEVVPAGFTGIAGVINDIGLLGAPVLPVAGELFVAEFVVTVVGAAGTSVALTASPDLAPTMPGFIGVDATIFDPTSDSATVTIAGAEIPEPASVAIFAGGAVAMIAMGRRRRRSRR